MATAQDHDQDTVAWPWFLTLWPAAVCFHVLGNGASVGPVAGPALGLAAAALLLRPRDRWPIAALAVVVLGSVWAEAPQLGNHWLLAGLVGLAAVLGGAGPRSLPAVRLVVLAFYGWAAFAKLNHDFLDPSTSCATYYLRESALSLGLGDPTGSAAVGWGVVLGTVLVELSIPVLLLVRRTRTAGVLVALCFHGVLALDRTHQFYDFSALLAAVFVTFLPAEVLGRAAALPRRFADVGRLRIGAAVLAVVAGLLSGRRGAEADAFDLGWLVWQVLGLALVVALGRGAIRHRWRGEPVSLRPPWSPAVVVVAVAVLNGALPYLEVKTGTAWNMYANLRVVDGDSNHLLVARSFPLASSQDDLVAVVASDDPVLDAYRTTGFVLPVRQLRWYLQRHPGVSAVLDVGGERVEVESGAPLPARLGPPVPDVVGRLLVLRATLPDGEPVGCQDLIYVAA